MRVVALCALLAVCAFSLSTVDIHATLTVHLRRVHDEATIEQTFVGVSEPASPNFRQHLSVEALTDLVRADPNAIVAVTTFLQSVGAVDCHLSSTHDIVTCTVPKGSALSATIRRPLSVKHAYTGRTSVQLAEHLRSFYRFAIAIWPQEAKKRQRRARTAGEPGMDQTPQTLMSRYNVPTQTWKFLSNFSQGVGEFEGEYFRESDMSAFVSKYGLHNISVPIMGPNPASGSDAIEGTLDLQYMGAMSLGHVPTWWLAQPSTSGYPGDIDFSLWTSSVMQLTNRPYVVSLSWGMGYQRYVFDPSVLNADNDAFRKMGLVGITVFAASGDSGPGVRSEELNCDTFTPSWPASSPYLTSVGATYANSMNESETSVKWSGGGFSTVFPRPSWQNAAVETYFTTAASKLPKASFYNATGRGYPDVSALGTNFEVFVGGSLQAISGTSCASPTFAGIVALIVGERVANGQPALGFLNPTIYKLGKVGQDIVAGQSEDDNCLFFHLPGFPAVPGWDAVSGLGTPDYAYLKANL